MMPTANAPVVERIDSQLTFETSRTDWWGYRVALNGHTPLDFWVLGANYVCLGDGYISREPDDERLGDGCSPHVCDDPHPDAYYDGVWNVVIEDLHHGR